MAQCQIVVSVGVPTLEPSPLGTLVPDLRPVLFFADARRRSSIGLAPTMLDASCGSGRHIVQAASVGWDVVALEASPDLLRYSVRRAERRGLSCLPELGTIHSYEGPDDAFDLVVLAGATVEEVETMFDLTVLLERATPLLRSTGVLVLGHALDGDLGERLDDALRSCGFDAASGPPDRRVRPGLVGYTIATRRSGSG